MASNFTKRFYATLRGKEEEKNRSSSPLGESGKIYEPSVTKETIASKPDSGSYSSNFYKTLREKSNETEKRFTPTIPDFRGQIATSRTPGTTRPETTKPVTTKPSTSTTPASSNTPTSNTVISNISAVESEVAKRKTEIEKQIEELETQKRFADQKIVGASRGNAMELLEQAKAEKTELEKQIAEYNEQLASLNKAENTLKMERYNAYTGAEDFAQYSAEGAAIENPDWKKAEGIGNIFGWRPFSEDVGNIVTYSRDNAETLRRGDLYGKDLVGDSRYTLMNEDEVSIYNYILAKEGEEAAQEYLDLIEETLNMRQGKETAEAIGGIDNDLLRAGATGLYGLHSGVDQFKGGVEQVFSEERLPTSSTQFASQFIREGLADAGPEVFGSSVGQILYDVPTMLGNMAPSIAVAAATAGAGAPAALASGTGALTLGASAGGNAYNQALAEGYSKDQARQYATAVGASEGVLQYLLGGVSKLGGVGSEKLLAKVSGIENAFARVMLTGGVKLGGEITEEELQLFLEPLYRTLIFDVEYDAPTFDEMAQTAIVTALTTGVIEGKSIVSAGKNNKAGEAASEPSLLPEHEQEIDAEPEIVPESEIEPETVQEAEPEIEPEEIIPETPEAALEQAAREMVMGEETPIDSEEGRRQFPNVNRYFDEQESTAEPTGEVTRHAETATQETAPAAEPSKRYGEAGAKALNDIVESTGLAPEQVETQFETAYELGRMDTPMDKVPLANDIQQTAYNAGRMDNIAEMGKTAKAPVENTANAEYTDGENTTTSEVQTVGGLSTLQAELSARDVASVNGIKFTLRMNSDGGYSLSIDRDNAAMGGYISDARGHMYSGGPYATREEAVQEALDVARYSNLVEQEETNNGAETVGEVPDERAVLEPDVSGQSDGRLLDELAAENEQEDARGRDAVPAPESGGRKTAGDAGRPDAQRDGRGRSVGSGEGRNLQPSDGAVKENDNGSEAERSNQGESSSVLGDRPEPEPSSGKRNETDSEFSEREAAEGRVIESDEEYLYGYVPVLKENWSDNARKVAQELDALNTPYVVIEGEIHFNKDGVTRSYRVEDAATFGNGKVAIPNHFDGVLHEKNVAAHETFHSLERRKIPEAIAYQDAVIAHANLSDDFTDAYITDIVNAYFKNGFDINNKDHQRRLFDELSAYISGDLYEGAVDISSAFDDFAAVKAAWERMIAAAKGETSQDSENRDDQSETTAQEVEQKTELATQEIARGVNFSIPAEGLKLPKGEKARFKANVEAIKTLRTLMSENRRATPAEQEILSKYVGWGGLANAFDEKKADWAKEYKQLKNLLTDKEYASARSSTLNAHYTDVGVIRAIYNGLAGIGFKGGRLLEPSAGIGHFAGAMPQDMAAGVSSWTMVELDELTGNIAKYLYPNADVRVMGFEAAKIPDNYMDMAISNVPFGNYAIVDKNYPKAVTGAIHNYFFAKALDKVRPGGIVTFITSRYTMDAQDSAVRHYIAQRADLLGAIRLPDSAFKSNAGTEVVTDILVLKKREPNTAYSGEEFEKTSWHHTNLGIYDQTNDYFAKHPEMVLGTPSSTGGMYRGNSLTYTAKPGNLYKQIEKAFSSIKGKMDYPVQRKQEEIRREIKEAAGKAKNGSIVKKDGKLYRNHDGVLQEASEINAKSAAAVSAIVEIRDTARQLLEVQLDGGSEKQIATFRKALNSQYDAFVKKYGILNSVSNKKLVNLDVDAPFILALENYDKETKTASKADIFTKNTITPLKTVTSVNTVEEGLIVSVNETGGVDAARIAELLGESEETVKRALLDNRLAFKNRDGKLETAEKYLSGNVKAKLRDAEALAEGDRDYEANVEELRKIIPADVAAEDISVQLGATWVPDSVYSDFAAEMLGTRNSDWKKSVDVGYNKLLGAFTVTLNDAWLKHRPENTSTWGTPDRSFINILEATLNSKSVTVTRKLEDGSRVVDKQATAAAQEKQEKIRAEFSRWLWADEKRKETLARLYNDIFNNYVTPKYDGSNLIVNGSNANKPLRAYQKDAVQRIVTSGGNTLLAHKVGAGKTYEMAAAAMKLRQLGIVKKPMFVVPKSLVAQWGNEFLDFFPAAKILVLGEKDFSAANRKLFANRIATGDYDAVILSQEQFKAVPMSTANQEAFYQEQITALELTITETARAKGKRDPSIKQMEKSKKSFEAKLKKLGDMKKDEDNIDFESLGVDAIFVDEAHSYKNLFYTTNMNNVSGLGNKDGSQKAFDLYMKVRYLQALNGGRGIVFATATPVMNSMSEMYIMQKYLQSDLLEARGLHSFDAWASQFGEVRTVLEMNPSGKGFRQKQSFSRFKNLAELQQMFRAFADVLTDIPGLKIPTMKEGKRLIVESEPSAFQLDFIDKLAERADAIKNRKVKPEEDNMLKVTSEGRKLSYTQRMIDPSLPYEDGNKIMQCAENVLSIWKETKASKGTQLIFCDLSTPKGSANTENTTEATDDVEDISIYDDIKNVLVGSGIPAKEIAFIHDANTNEKKAKLFKDVNDGKVRLLIGSTGKMGVGMNAQKRIVALHHLDAPWRPGDIEQREGRALRQGNMNDEVGIYVYVTKQTFDSRMWDNLQRKASFIHQVMAGDLTARESEGDGDFALSAAEIKAISSGNPLIMEQFEVAAEIAKLENLEHAHAKEVADAKKRIEKAKLEIVSDELTVERLREDIKTRQDTSGDKFKLTVGQKTFTERKAAGEALIAEAKKRLKIVRDSESAEEIGSFAGFKLLVTNGGELLLRGKGQYRAQVNMESEVGTATRLEEAVKRLDTLLKTAETRLSENKQAITKLEKTAASSFDKADDLLELRKRNAAILAELNPDDEKNVADLSDDDGDDTDNMAATTTAAEEKWSAERVGSGEKAPMRLSEIIEKIRHDFGINITTGHIRGRDTLGQYNRSNKGIKTKIANDLPTVAHELGHHLDTTYKLTDELDEALEKELIDGLDAGMKAAYPEEKWAREGLAEYIRKYLQNRETAAIDYPEFTKHFLNNLSTTDAVLIAQLADEVNAYYALDVDTATSSIRFREEGSADARTFAEKIKAKASVLYQAWVDANHGIKLYDEATGSNAYTLANNAAYSDAMAGQIIAGDLTDANGQYVAPGLKTVLQGINLNDKTEYRLFGEYLTVKHGPERLAEGMRIFADDRKNSTTFMEQRRDELERQYPQFKEAAERLYDFQQQFLQTWGVDTGLVSKESAKEWAERWHYYVPLNRAVSEEQRGIGAKRGFANQNSTIKKARGSGLDIVHPVDNVINNVVKMVNAGVRNNVMRAITDSAAKLGANAEFLEKVPTPMVRRGFDMTGVKEQLRNGIDEALTSGELTSEGWDTVDTMIENVDDILYQYGKGKAHGDVITVLKNGKQEFWKINDPLLLQSITTLSPAKMEGILDAYAVVSRFMTANITGYNVVWALFSNFPRDLMTMFTYSKTKDPIKLAKAMGSAYMNKAGNMGEGLDPLYREYVALGGGNISAYTADRNLAKRARDKLAGKISKNPIDAFAFTSEVIEMGPRYATYKLLRENGVSPQEAFAGAMDITVNFRRGGRIAREMNKVIPFFNVSIQGLDKFRRWITAEDAGNLERKKVVRSRVISYVAVSAALAALFYALNNGDDEEEKNYEQLSNYQKNSFWNIPLGDGKYFAIPKPRELGVLSSFFETAMEYGIGENDHAFDEFYAYAAQNLLPKIASDLAQIPSKGVVETGMSVVGNLGLVGVFGYLGANRDFLGRPIVSSGLQNLEPKDQYTNRTSKIAYWLGQATNSSPVQIDYFFQQVLGGFWKYQKALLPVGGENVDKTFGVQNTYVKDNQFTTDLVNWMYDQADKSAKEKNSNPTDMNAAITAKMDNNMTTFYSRFYSLSKDTKETTASRGARQTVLDMILEYQKATDSGATTAAQRAVYAVAKKQGNTEALPGVMQTTVKDGNDRTHTLSSVQYVEYQTDYLRLYWEHVEDGLSATMSDAEKAAVLKQAKLVAKEEATNRTLARIGAKQTDYFDSYGTAGSDAIVSYKANRAVANADGSVTQDEVAEIILSMIDKGLDDDTAYNLYTSEYEKSKDVVEGAKAAGVDAATFMEFKHNLKNLEYEKGVNGAKKEAFIEMLDEMGLDDEAYDFLFGTEYKSKSSSNSLFGDSLF